MVLDFHLWFVLDFFLSSYARQPTDGFSLFYRGNCDVRSRGCCTGLLLGFSRPSGAPEEAGFQVFPHPIRGHRHPRPNRTRPRRCYSRKIHLQIRSGTFERLENLGVLSPPSLQCEMFLPSTNTSGSLANIFIFRTRWHTLSHTSSLSSFTARWDSRSTRPMSSYSRHTSLPLLLVCLTSYTLR
jgi:hypothetical protein